MTDIPQPIRRGWTYVCPEWVGGVVYAEQRKCGHPFIFRSSYERHWREEHGEVSVDYDPAIVGGGVYPSKDHPPVALPVVDGLPGPGSPVALSADPRVQPGHEHRPVWERAAAQMGLTPRADGTVHLEDADLSHMPEGGAIFIEDEPTPWTEVDRKNAAARLDTYLEQTSGTFTVQTKDPIIIGILAGQLDWNPEAQEYQRVHRITATPCTCSAIHCNVVYHHCTVCEIVTLTLPPLPCPGPPRKDTP